MSAPEADYRIPDDPMSDFDFIDFYSDEENCDKLQKQLFGAHEKQRLGTMSERAARFDPREAVRLRSTTSRNSTWWLTAVPSDNESRISNSDFSYALSLHAHITPPSLLPYLSKKCTNCSVHSNASQRAIDATLVDDPFHALSCLGNQHSWNLRHKSVYEIIAAAVNANGGDCRIEPRDTSAHNRTRPDLEIILGDRHIFVDVAIIHPTSAARISFNNPHRNDAMNAMSKKVIEKEKKYNTQCKEIGAEFVAAIFDSYGAVSAPAMQLLYDIACYNGGAMIAQCFRWSHQRLFTAVACAIQRGNGYTMRTGVQSLIVNAPIRRRAAVQNFALQLSHAANGPRRRASTTTAIRRNVNAERGAASRRASLHAPSASASSASFAASLAASSLIFPIHQPSGSSSSSSSAPAPAAAAAAVPAAAQPAAIPAIVIAVANGSPSDGNDNAIIGNSGSAGSGQ